MPYTDLEALEKCSWFGYPTAFPISLIDSFVAVRSWTDFFIRKLIRNSWGLVPRFSRKIFPR
jgi:hypothetical protein